MWIAIVGLLCFEGQRECEWAAMDSSPLVRSQQVCEMAAELFTANMMQVQGKAVKYIDIRCIQIKGA